MKSIKPDDFKVTEKIKLADISTDLDINTSKKQEATALDDVQIKLSK